MPSGSLSFFPIHIHDPINQWFDEHFPGNLSGGQSGFELYSGVRPFLAHPMWFDTKIYFKSLLTVSAPGLRGATKRNKAKCITNLYPKIADALQTPLLAQQTRPKLS